MSREYPFKIKHGQFYFLCTNSVVLDDYFMKCLLLMLFILRSHFGIREVKYDVSSHYVLRLKNMLFIPETGWKGINEGNIKARPSLSWMPWLKDSTEDLWMPNILLKPVDKRKNADAGYGSHKPFTDCVWEREILYWIVGW